MPDDTAERVAKKYSYKQKETKEHRVDRLKKVLREATGLSGGVSEQIADAYVRGREVERLALQKGWPVEDGVVTGDSGQYDLRDFK